MRPLWFLALRSTLNGIRRAFTSPRRLIGLLVVVGYYVSFIFRATLAHPPTSTTMPLSTKLAVPSIDIIEAVIFAIFALLSVTMMLSVFAPRGGFRAADVDVLFPTPVSPKLVLGFRMVREYLVTLLVPLFLIIITGKSAVIGYQFLLHGTNMNGPLALRMMSVAWFLMSLAWVCLSFGLSMFVNRSDQASDKNKRLINGVFIGGLLLGVVYAALRLQQNLSWNTALDLSQSMVERVVFFSATGSTAIVTGALESNFVTMAFGIVGLLAVAGLGIWMAVSQVGYMYDQAAARGFQTSDIQKLQRSGDMMGVMAERARQGKFKRGRLSTWIGKQRFPGGLAIIWKEVILQLRGSSWQYIVFIPLMLMMLMPLWGQRGQGSVYSVSLVLLAMLGFGVFIFTMSGATSGFIELLRRMDLQKPLPFSPTTTVFWETASKAVPATVATTLAILVAVAIDWRLWQTAIAAVFLMPSFAVVLSSVILIVTLLFPDIEDATQRGFRGLMTMLGLAIAAFPGAFVVGLLFGYFKVFPILAALPAIGLNLGIAVGICFISGSLYAQFNPSE